MVALPNFSNVGWFLEDPITLEKQENSYFCRGKNENSYFLEGHFPCNYSSVLQVKNGDHFAGFGDGLIQEFAAGADNNKLVYKKLNHNACERDRRKKINTLYTTLRSLLPDDDQSKKLSIPATVSRVLKYIPDLQKQVERLKEKKQNLLTRISKQGNSIIDSNNGKATQSSSASVVSATRISDREIICQISMPKIEKGSFSKVLHNLEQEGFLVMNTSRFESSEGRIFYNMHLQGQGSLCMDAEILKEKLLSFYEKGGEIVF